MGNKRKGQLTTDIEWHKHLRKIGKRFFWKGERIAEKKMITKNLSEFDRTTEVSLLAFDELFDMVEENRFKNEVDKKIAQKILEAERDWTIPLESLYDLITILEKEVAGIVTKSSLKTLLKNYNQNPSQKAWEAESICYLLDIFDLTKEIELKIVFIELTKKYQKSENNPGK